MHLRASSWRRGRREAGSWLGFQQGQRSEFSPGEAKDLQRTCVSGEGVVGGQEKSLLSFPLGGSIGWSDERNRSSPKGRGRWLTAAGASSSLPHRLFLNCHYFKKAIFFVLFGSDLGCLCVCVCVCVCVRACGGGEGRYYH